MSVVFSEVQKRAAVLAILLAVAIGFAACGDDDGEPAPDPKPDQSGLSNKQLGPFAPAAAELEREGFAVLDVQQVLDCAVASEKCSDAVIGHYLDAEKRGAEYTAALFKSAQDAAVYSESYLPFSKEHGFPAELDGSALYYSRKCCTDAGPPPVVPQDDYDRFVEIIDETR